MEKLTSYQEEVQDLHHRRVYFIILVGSLMILGFSGLDSIVAPTFFTEFLTYRAIAVLFGITLIVANYHDSQQQYSLVIGFLGYLSCSLAVMAMIYRMGGTASPYFVGLIVTMTVYTAFAPLTMLQTLGSGFCLVGCYIITLQLSQSFGPPYPMELFTNLFFVICFIFIAATQSWADTVARTHEYHLRHQEMETAEQLSHHAEILEQEVEKRTKEQQASEKRYRLLFNQIADDVAVVTQEGKIIQSNESFDQHYSDQPVKKKISLYDIISLQDHRCVKENLATAVTTGEPISALQLSLKRIDGGVTEVEINGTLLKRQTTIIGVLLVIRDISTRKFLENRLLESLKIKKQTEGAAILALAKLSEYRDLTPKNHLERIREYCKVLTEELSDHPEFMEIVTPTYIQDIYHASILHDIGKVSIPDQLLNKKGALTKQEQDTIRQHTLAGGDVIKEMEEENKGSGFLSIAKQIAYFHHERWDGKGYPQGLQGKETPLPARIMSLADAYEELTTSTRQGTELLTHSEAIQAIVTMAGSRFDPVIVETFISRQDDFDEIRQRFTEA